MKTLIYQFRYALPVWFCFLVTAWLPDNRICIRVRGFLVSIFLPGSPAGLTVGRDVTLLGISSLVIGSNVYIAKGCWINALGGITICSEVMVAPYVVLASTKHKMVNGSVYGSGSSFAPIKIGFGSWLAAHCTVTSGVSVGKGCIIAANSVVSSDVPDDEVHGGVPAKKICELG